MSAFDAYCDLEGTIKGSIQYDEPMARHTSYRIGGPASLFIECSNIADIKRCFEVISDHGLPWCVIGKGSNLLVSDEGFKGAVITLGTEFKAYSFPNVDEGQSLLVSGAGAILSTLVQNAFKGGYSGLEYCVGIPGTLGGALFMNAGSGQEWIGGVVQSVTVLAPELGLKSYSAADLPWNYRSSGILVGEVILEAKLNMQKGHLPSIRAKMEGSLRRRRKTQPLTVPSCGSVFRNPVGDSAGRMIESLGLKGFSIGGAKVSEVHANFIVNDNKAKAADVIEIIMHVQQRVKEEYGQELQPEVRFIGFS